jgi:hypothetical protein
MKYCLHTMLLNQLYNKQFYYIVAWSDCYKLVAKRISSIKMKDKIHMQRWNIPKSCKGKFQGVQ